MNGHDGQVLAGFVSSMIFIGSNFPMVFKALKTRDLRSYSLGQIGLANLGNMLHWLYVVGLPVGPVWLLHGFNSAVAVLMLGLYVRYELAGGRRRVHHALKPFATDSAPAPTSWRPDATGF